MKTILLVILLAATPMFAVEIQPTSTAANAVNALGVDLLRHGARPDANFLISPYSIQTALAMTYAGADGRTRDEMQRALHYPKDETEMHQSFAALQAALNHVIRQSSELQPNSGFTNEPITLAVANRLFGQQGFDFRAPFLALMKENYHAPFETMDFVNNPADATKRINSWVEEQTQQRIHDLIPGDALNPLTRLVLVNAIYFKAQWLTAFRAEATKPLPFHIAGGTAADVPTMVEHRMSVGYAKRDAFTVVTIPYSNLALQFVILLPDKTTGIAALESRLNADLLAGCAELPSQRVDLYLPKFKLELPALSLGKDLQALGMKSAFDVPLGSADFDRIAPRRPNHYLYLSAVFHKTFLKLDENGTEASATSVIASDLSSADEPIEVHVDHPFLFAIQHRPSGACLFLGHVTDPR